MLANNHHIAATPTTRVKRMQVAGFFRDFSKASK